MDIQKPVTKRQTKALWYVAAFAIAMAYLESAVVVYLRRIYNINDLMTSLPYFDLQIGSIEVGRELATLFMLLAVGWAVGEKLQSRLGFAVFAFGIWDIFYYIWLRVFIGWPASLFDLDLLFMIPLPWWGPVLSPVCIAVLMVVGGVRAVLLDDREMKVHFRPVEWVAMGSGILIILYAFMADALKLLPADVATLTQMKPSNFNWLVYLVGFVLVAYAVWQGTSPQNKR